MQDTLFPHKSKQNFCLFHIKKKKKRKIDNCCDLFRPRFAFSKVVAVFLVVCLFFFSLPLFHQINYPLTNNLLFYSVPTLTMVEGPLS